MVGRIAGVTTVLVAMGLAGCSGEVVSSADMGLTVSEDADGVLRGTYRTEDALVSFSALQETELAARVSVAINGATFDLTVDREAGVLSTDGHDAVLSAAERETMLALAEQVANHVGPGLHDHMHVSTLVLAADYWSEAPDGHVHAGRTLLLDGSTAIDGASEDIGGNVSASLGGDGITCVGVGDWHLTQVDADDHGTLYQKWVRTGACWGDHPTTGGDYDCMGRCGAGCGTWWKVNNYTLDCLEHDACSYRFGASGGSSDYNCGDEYDESADDWMNATWHGCDDRDKGLGC